MAAEGPPIHEINWQVDQRSPEAKAERARRIKELFSSVQWYYPVHKCFGDIVLSEDFSVDYRLESKVSAYFNWYEDMVSEFMEHLARGMDYSYTGSETAAAVLRALPSHKNIVQHLPDGGTLISEKDAIYLLGAHNKYSFGYLLKSCTIDLKLDCLDFMQKELEKLAGTKPAIANLEKKIREFVDPLWGQFVKQQRELVKKTNVELCAYEVFEIKRTTSLSFIMSEGIDSKEMSSAPMNPRDWNNYFIKVCKERLRLTLEKEEKQWEADLSELHAHFQPKMNGLFRSLKDTIAYAQYISGKSDTNKACLGNFQSEIRRLLKIVQNTR